jgi:pimeloyl-ACP methyl ester carboxylesterase
MLVRPTESPTAGPIRKKMTSLQPADATSHFVEANGVKLHYLDYGVAGRRPMLCLHGGAAHAHWFDFVAPGLRTNHHVRALDLRGHGDSAWSDPHSYAFKTFAEDVHRVVETLDLRDFVLIGHSMGGMVSLAYAATHPGRVSRLIVVDSIMLMSMDRIEKMRQFGAKPAPTYTTQEELIARYRLEPADSQMAAPEIVHHLATHSIRKGADGRWQHKADRRVYANFQQLAGIPYWEKIKVPALVIRGEHSTRFGPAELAEIRARAPQVRMEQVPASDHHITLDNPPAFVDAVQAFLRA